MADPDSVKGSAPEDPWLANQEARLATHLSILEVDDALHSLRARERKTVAAMLDVRPTDDHRYIRARFRSLKTQLEALRGVIKVALAQRTELERRAAKLVEQGKRLRPIRPFGFPSRASRSSLLQQSSVCAQWEG